MNPDMPKPPREELEVRLTALLLGELAAEEAAALRELIANDTQLSGLYERLKRAIDVVREAAAPGTEPTAAPPAPLKLSDERRQKLLAHFKTVAPKEFVPHPRRREWSWLVPLSAVAVAIMILAAITIPNFTKARENAQVNSVLNNLRILEGAKDQWALENKKSGNDVVTLGDLKDYLKGGAVRPVQGEHYNVGRVSDPVTADVDASLAKKTFGGLATKQPTQAAPGQRARVNADGGLSFVDKNAQASTGAPSGREASVILTYSSEKQVEANLRAPSESRPSSAQVFQKDVSTRSMPATDEKKREAASLDVRFTGITPTPRQYIVLPTVSEQAGDTALAKGPSQQPAIRSFFDAGDRGGFAGVGGGGGVGGAGFGNAPADPLSIRKAGDPKWVGVLEAPAPAPRSESGIAAFALQPERPALPNEPPVNSESKLAESSRTDNKALGFAWYDRDLKREGRLGMQGGVAPSLAGQPSKAKPEIRDMDAGTPLSAESLETSRSPALDNGRTMQERYFGGGVAGAKSTVTPIPGMLSPERAVELNRLDDRLARKSDGANESVPPAKRSLELGELFLTSPDTSGAEGKPKVQPPEAPLIAGKEFTRANGAEPSAVVGQNAGRTESLGRNLAQLGDPAKTIALGVEAAGEIDAAGKTMNRDASSSSSLQAPLYYKLMSERYGVVPPGASPPSPPTERGETTATATPPSVKTTPPSEEAIGRKSPSIVLPSMTTDTIAGAPIVNTSSLTPQNEPTQIEASNSQRPVPAPTPKPETLRRAEAEAQNAKKQEPGAIAKNRAYFEARQQVENLQRLRDNTILRLEQKKIEAALAKKGAVEIVDPAEVLPTVQTLKRELSEQDSQVAQASEQLDRLRKEMKISDVAEASAMSTKSAAPAPIPQPEVQTRDNAFSTFALNVSDVSFKLAGASLEKGVMPEPATVRSEEFINAFDYRDPEPPPGVPIAFAWERTRYPFAHNRDLLRFSVKTAAAGRQPGRPLNLVVLLDNSGSMERADRVQIIQEALRVLAAQLQPQDKLSVVTFARTARLWADGVPGNQSGAIAEQISTLTPQGGTNLGDAMDLAYQTALRHYLANGVNRVVLLTDGAANLGNVDPDALKLKVEAQRKQGIALDCFGIGWEGYNDDLLEVLSRNGDGRYGFINTPEEATSDFAGQLAGALRVAASDVKVQVEFNPGRVTAYRQIGYAKHQLTKEQFRDNTVDAAEIGAAESGNALYVAEVIAGGEGPLAIVRVRYKVPGTADYREHEWAVAYTGNAVSLEQASPAMRLAATASAFSEWLVSSPYAAEITPDGLLGYLREVPETFGADPRPKKLEWMIRQAGSIAGK
jgi:Mg-chelatase subunit ChlD